MLAWLRRSGFGRYLLLQTPGLAIAAAVVIWAHDHYGLPRWVSVGAWGIWAAKDLAMWPFVRRAFEPAGRTDGAGSLLERRGVVVERLAPAGLVRVGPELWRAELPAGATPLEAGAAVRVRDVEGLVLRVEPEEGTGSPAA